MHAILAIEITVRLTAKHYGNNCNFVQRKIKSLVTVMITVTFEMVGK